MLEHTFSSLIDGNIFPIEAPYLSFRSFILLSVEVSACHKIKLFLMAIKASTASEMAITHEAFTKLISNYKKPLKASAHKRSRVEFLQMIFMIRTSVNSWFADVS